jgi:hypothetical protein
MTPADDDPLKDAREMILRGPEGRWHQGADVAPQGRARGELRRAQRTRATVVLYGGAWLAHKVVPPWAFSPTLLLNFVLLVAVGGAIFCHAISKPKRA